jgi:polar amino acid transport system permease protein
VGWEDVFASREVLLHGFRNTVSLSVVTILTSSVLGLAVALARTAQVRFLSPVLRGYLEVFRGSPLLIQMLFIYYGAAYVAQTYELPALTAGYLEQFSTYEAALVALTLYEGALISEIFRAGIESVPPGQREAARSLGLSKVRVMTDVVLPQSLKVALAPLVGQYIGLVKDTALAATIVYAELVLEGQAVIARIGLPFHVYILIAAMYFIVCYPMSLAAARLEKRGARA